MAIPALSAGVEVASPLLTQTKRERVGVPLAKDPTSQEGLWVLNRTSIERESKQGLSKKRRETEPWLHLP